MGDRLLDPANNRIWKGALWLIVILLLVDVLLGWYWSWEPDLQEVRALANAQPGEVTTLEVINVASTLLDKPGGYLSNDVLPHRLWLDNMPSWEFGVLVQLRDMVRVMRRDMSRSQSQSQEDRNLAIAEPQFNFDSRSWAMPATESEYRRGIRALERYLESLRSGDGRFYARADNLNSWLNEVQNRLGALSQDLSRSVGRTTLDTEENTPVTQLDSKERVVKTPWMKIDNVFYEARGASWALVQLMRALEVDFADVLRKKNATVSFRQMVRELEATQETLWSPMVLNGSGFGIFANHSLVMANYLSRANASLIDLRKLLQEG
ncbi:DUF2333 family protein [Alloalcanivorax xenomutans]|nr:MULTISPECIES: DUF2333 family protein [Alloalcanivorax]ARB47787.1 hypothetical protein P40_04875 [Alloalcanivorax xenomutans]WOA33592.1 DUF2333 family protein [Alloalcanivorax xenomutans]WOD30504.1 DUF2333 family protein [Alloalcanivorax xenomutans]